MASPLYPVSTAQIRSTGLLDPRLLDHQIPSRPSASSSFNVDILPFYHPGSSGYTYEFSHSHKIKKEQGPSDAWKQGSEREVSSAQQSHQACGPISHTSEPNTVAKERKSTGQSETGLGILPYGMDITEALEKCEDPSLGWSLQFWVTIADPVVSLPLSKWMLIDRTKTYSLLVLRMVSDITSYVLMDQVIVVGIPLLVR